LKSVLFRKANHQQRLKAAAQSNSFGAPRYEAPGTMYLLAPTAGRDTNAIGIKLPGAEKFGSKRGKIVKIVRPTES